ncbi:hypothetical protein L228DRAFT_269382 [Xylona heveae TC161]|uniref:HAUS augmin-like complex subunit 1 n=1 Tax=Xylona heveae (strain CBS 132557 / TC161) TaxID=1328760 RepID=A0A165GA61_XYLHT|nr:hypothetical protein L228DRAFT_269382 [Xylona heveae TC161]KZF21939.1 hypothetical protein L228DRAFT_269382 [Xylona heveae TC161]
MTSQFSPGAIFSPSQARQQLAQARDWSYIDDWLAKMYGAQSIPTFERNTDTLKALLALAAVNESAEEEKELVRRLECTVLGEVDETAEPGQDIELLLSLHENLSRDGSDSLDAMASAGLKLGSLDPTPESLAGDIFELNRLEFDMEQHALRMHSIHTRLELELSRLEREIAKFQNDSVLASSSLPQRTAEWTRATKQFVAKSLDYKNRINSLSRREPPRPGIAQIQALERDSLAMQTEVQGLELRVANFHGLPPQQGLAKKEAERARRELQDLTRRRDRLFEGLIEEDS